SQSAKDLLIDLRRLKKRLEVEVELERGVPSMESTPPQAKTTGPAATARTTSSADYIVNQVRTHKRGAVVALGVLVLAAATLLWYVKHSRAALLTEKDSILLADFVNTTGDTVFDGTLKQALAIQLE